MCVIVIVPHTMFFTDECTAGFVFWSQVVYISSLCFLNVCGYNEIEGWLCDRLLLSS